jgi:hypothetical protein
MAVRIQDGKLVIEVPLSDLIQTYDTREEAKHREMMDLFMDQYWAKVKKIPSYTGWNKDPIIVKTNSCFTIMHIHDDQRDYFIFKLFLSPKEWTNMKNGPTMSCLVTSLESTSTMTTCMRFFGETYKQIDEILKTIAENRKLQ